MINIHFYHTQHHFCYLIGITNCIDKYKPCWPRSSRIKSVPSLRHIMFGVGDPEAAHLNDTLLSSRMFISVLVG